MPKLDMLVKEFTERLSMISSSLSNQISYDEKMQGTRELKAFLSRFSIDHEHNVETRYICQN